MTNVSLFNSENYCFLVWSTPPDLGVLHLGYLYTLTEKTRTFRGIRDFSIAKPNIWNKLPKDVQLANS